MVTLGRSKGGNERPSPSGRLGPQTVTEVSATLVEQMIFRVQPRGSQGFIRLQKVSKDFKRIETWCLAWGLGSYLLVLFVMFCGVVL